MKKTLITLAAIVLFAATAFADDVCKIGTSSYSSLSDAFSWASDGDEIVLTSDVTVSSTIEISSAISVTLNLNGHTLTNDVTSARLFEITAGGASFTIDGTTEGSTMASSDAAASYGTVRVSTGSSTVSTVVLNGGTYNIKHDNGAALFRQNTGAVDVTIKNITLTTNAGAVATTNSTSYAVNLTVEDCNFTQGPYSELPSAAQANPFTIIYWRPSYYGPDCTANLRNVEITSDGMGGYGSYCKTTNLHNCKFVVEDNYKSYYTAALNVANLGETYITGDDSYFYSNIAGHVYSSGGYFNIDGGTFIGTEASLELDCTYANQGAVVEASNATLVGNVVLKSVTTDAYTAVGLYDGTTLDGNITVSCTSDSSEAIVDVDGASVDGDITVSCTNESASVEVYVENGTVEGDITISGKGETSVEVSGGEINGTITNNSTNSESSVEITGGTFGSGSNVISVEGGVDVVTKDEAVDYTDSNYTAYYVTGVSADGALELVAVEGVVPAGASVLLFASDSEIQSSFITLGASGDTADLSGNLLSVVSDDELPENVYVLATVGSSKLFVPIASSGYTLPSGAAYLKMSEARTSLGTIKVSQPTE